VVADRDGTEARLLASFSQQKQRLLRDLLTRLVAGQPDAGRLGELRDDEGHQKLTMQ
jgi:hypothetical protein